jgi:hypothetical protein
MKTATIRPPLKDASTSRSTPLSIPIRVCFLTMSPLRSKYVDSHLRPYRCKIDPGACGYLRFSSNACLLRHEREAHGEHTHGINPFLCKFEGCERAKPANGFPRRWNQRDHMKRVHQYEESDASSKKNAGGRDPLKRRKVTKGPASVPMQRSGPSAMSQDHIMASLAYHLPEYEPISRDSYATPAMYAFHPQPQEYNAMMTRPVTMSEVQLAHPAISRTARYSPPYPGTYPA